MESTKRELIAHPEVPKEVRTVPHKRWKIFGDRLRLPSTSALPHLKNHPFIHDLTNIIQSLPNCTVFLERHTGTLPTRDFESKRRDWTVTTGGFNSSTRNFYYVPAPELGRREKLTEI